MDNLGKENMRREIKIVCAWCGKDIGEIDGKGVEGVSHGLCLECLAKLKVKNGENGMPAGNDHLE